MNKKLLLIIPIVLVGLLMLTSCNNGENSVNAASSNSRFVTNAEYISISTFSDSQTGVEYAIVKDYAQGNIQVVVLQNADGTPKVKQ